MEYVYNIAGLNILIKSPYEIPYMNNFENFYNAEVFKGNYDIIYNFIENNKQISFKSKPLYSDIEYKIFYENNTFYREFTYLDKDNAHGCLVDEGENNYTCYLYRNFSDEKIRSYNIFNSLAIENALIKYDVFILHSSFLNYKNNAILFSGPSGIGKSTQADLWEEYKGAEIINGDRSLLRKKDGKWYAYGSPFAGSSKIYKNKSYPIKAIIMLKKGKSNKITKLNKIESFKYLIRESTINYFDINFYNKVIDLLVDLIDNVSVYLLECLPNKEAVDLLDNYIK